MSFFYKDRRLTVGLEGAPSNSLDIEKLARSTSGPVYIYDLDDIAFRFGILHQALQPLNHTIHYAMKANSNPIVLKKLSSLGAGADTVSGGEIKRALDASIKPEKIIFSGVGKTVAEIELAIQKQIKQINVESPQELERIADVAKRLGKKTDVAFRLNPDVDAKTHPYITTGFRENKFGMDESFVPELIAILGRNSDSLRLRGLTMHIGSQIFDLKVLQEAIEKTIGVHLHFVKEGFQLDRLDIGGGLGVNYAVDHRKNEIQAIQDYGAMVKATLSRLLPDSKIEILLEPGRILVARAGLLVGEVQYVKRAPAKTFAILDTGMHHLIRPALYSAEHRVLPVLERTGDKKAYDIVGPICESSDFLAKNILLSEVSQGDLLALADAGAYGFTMASQYNSHELPIEIAVSEGKVIK